MFRRGSSVVPGRQTLRGRAAHSREPYSRHCNTRIESRSGNCQTRNIFPRRSILRFRQQRKTKQRSSAGLLFRLARLFDRLEFFEAVLLELQSPALPCHVPNELLWSSFRQDDLDVEGDLDLGAKDADARPAPALANALCPRPERRACSCSSSGCSPSIREWKRLPSSPRCLHRVPSAGVPARGSLARPRFRPGCRRPRRRDESWRSRPVSWPLPAAGAESPARRRRRRVGRPDRPRAG